MGKFILAPRARLDLLDIFQYGIECFGFSLSEQFQDELNTQFQEIAKSPLQYQAVDEIMIGVPSLCLPFSFNLLSY